MFTLAAITVERKDAVLKPARQRVRMCDRARSRRVVQLIWIVALVFVNPIVVFLKKIDVTCDIVDCGFAQNNTTVAEFGRIYDSVCSYLIT